MKAMILAAGRGERMRPLSDHTHKALLEVGGKTLIAYHLQALKAIGITEVVINLSHLAGQMQEYLDSNNFGVTIHYSLEPQVGGLETGGGIFNALPLLGNQPFIVINSDVWTDFPLQKLLTPLSGLAHIVLVDNPEHNSKGDFALEDGFVNNWGQPRFTFAGIGVYHPRLFQHCQPGAFRLAPLLCQAMQQQRVSGEYYTGNWVDVGTPQRLQALRQRLASHT